MRQGEPLPDCCVRSVDPEDHLLRVSPAASRDGLRQGRDDNGDGKVPLDEREEAGDRASALETEAESRFARALRANIRVLAWHVALSATLGAVCGSKQRGHTRSSAL